MQRYNTVFKNNKALIGMVHLNGRTDEDRMSRALYEAKLYEKFGYDGIIIENYFGSEEHVDSAVELIKNKSLKLKVGVNILGNTAKAFQLSNNYDLDFIQIDSVSGHLRPDQESQYEEELNQLREHTNAIILGGVRFKYQPVLSNRSEHDDLIRAKNRCDAIVVTGDATGQETSITKIQRFRASLGNDFPLIIGAGITSNNIFNQYQYANAGIVGSWVKSSHQASGEVEPKYLAELKKALIA